MHLHERAADNLSFIRNTMERAAAFTAVPGYGGIAMGVSAIVMGLVAHAQSAPELWLRVWLAELAIGVFIAVMMAVGALFAALNTMYSAVAARTREIATLRALGFGSSPIVMSVLVESIVIALIGGAVGAGAAWLAFDGYQASTINWQTFSQVTFAFAVTPALLGTAILWATTLGLIGGFFPAIRAARLPIAMALRET